MFNNVVPTFSIWIIYPPSMFSLKYFMEINKYRKNTCY